LNNPVNRQIDRQADTGEHITFLGGDNDCRPEKPTRYTVVCSTLKVVRRSSVTEQFLVECCTLLHMTRCKLADRFIRICFVTKVEWSLELFNFVIFHLCS